MANLHITNLTGKQLSLICLSERKHVEPGEKAQMITTLPAMRSTLRLRVCGSLPQNNEKVLPSDSVDSTFWDINIQPPRSFGGNCSWGVAHPICQHKRRPGARTPSAKHCQTCQANLPWTAYALHTRTESHIVFLRIRDMSSFLSELSDGTPLSDLVLPGTHDSLAFYGWPVTQCQSPDQPLSNQLLSGIRVLDVRLSVIDGVLMAYHGTSPQHASFSAVLHTLHQFLRDRPRECVVVSLKQEDFTTTPWWVFSRCVREELERGGGGWGMWWLENRIPTLGEVRGRCIMLSRFGGEGQGWDRGLEGMGIHPTTWPDSERDGFQWNLKGTTVRTHDWYRIPSLLSLPEKAALCIQNLVPDLTVPPTLSITYLSASGGPLALPPFCALGFGWPRWGLGVEGVDARVGGWLLHRITSSSPTADSEKDRLSTYSDVSDARLLGAHTEDEPKRPVRGWVFLDYFAEPDDGIVPLLVEHNFIGRYGLC